MGANASTANGQSSSEQAAAAGPTDYYALLGVEVEATSEEIRKAFRREALKWHPDKNAGSEEASKRFIKIQAAYDVLSDNQERAYYDSHRGDLGDDENVDGVDLRQRAQQASNVKQSVRISAKQLTRFFDGSLWNNDFSDSSEGFYGIYRTLFETISQSEMYATAPAGEAPLSPSVQYPSFGNSGTTYDAPDSELKQFYSAFLSFASRRPFNEADKYRLQDAPDRQVRRLMERENKKARDDARREYNEAVRSLAAFLKKRDPRFLNSASSDPVKLKQLEKKRLEAQLREAALQAAKQREKAAKAYVEQDWMKVKRNVAVEDEWDESDSLEEGEAHKGMDESPQEAGFEGEDEEPVDDWYCAACDKIFGSQGAWDNHERSRKHLQNTKRLKKEMLAEDESMATSQELSTPQEAEEPKNGELDIDDLEKEFRKLSKKERKRFGLHKLQAFEERDADLASAASSNPKESEEALAASTTAKDTESPEPEAEARAVIPEKANDESAIPQISKRDKRRAREAAKKAAQLESPAEEVCRVCSAKFSSRSKLFSHIEETGHASATGEQPVSVDHPKGKKKGKRK